MLIGSYNHTIDDKSRVTIPAKWRQDLSVGFVLLRGMEKTIWAMPMAEWEKLYVKLSSMSIVNKTAQNFVRELTRWASECEMDKQGRVVIPQKLREIAQIKEEVELIGVANRIEIWSAELRTARDEEEGDNYDECLAAAVEFGI